MSSIQPSDSTMTSILTSFPNRFSLLPTTHIYDPRCYEGYCSKHWTSIGVFDGCNRLNQDGATKDNTDGPPFVSGSLHMGHLGPITGKSIISNWDQLSGFGVDMTLGYDCHGLPVENKIRKMYDVNGMNVAEFNDRCDRFVTEVSDSWTPIFQKIGRHADYNKKYMTRDFDCMQTHWWILHDLYSKDLVYMGKKVMPYSYGMETPLSNFEAGLAYREIDTVTVYAKFPIVEAPDAFIEAIGDVDFTTLNLVAWTTTPWTLPSNLALCVNKDVDYCVVEMNDDLIVIAQSRIVDLFGKKQAKKVKIISQFKGSAIVGCKYAPITNHMSNVIMDNGFDRDVYHRVFSDNYVKDDGGTGIVHMAPAFGEDDYRVCEVNGIVDTTNIEMFCPVDQKGCYTVDVPEFTGRNVFTVDKDIRTMLKDSIINSKNIKHNYPYCYRTDTPLIYMAVTSWFIRVSALKERMVELNDTVTWRPGNIGKNRFGKWIENAKDWAISRNRMWGTPIPIWVNTEDDSDIIVVKSAEHLYELSGVLVDNLHPEFVNNMIIERDGNTYKRTPYIFDCWYESGCVPFSQRNYPFSEESKVLETREFLSDYVCEGLDQTRGWFYTLLVISTAVLDKAPYRYVQCMGLVMDKDGRKFSKKYGNGVNPTEIIEKFGADAVRMYIAGSPLMSADLLYYNEENLKNCRSRMIPFYNSVIFMSTHVLRYMGSIDHKTSTPLFSSAYDNIDELTNVMDKWILNVTAKMCNRVTDLMNDKDIAPAVNDLFEYVDTLTNWYLKFNRDRMKGIKGDDEAFTSLNVLYTCIMTYIRLSASFMPFMSENIFQHIKHASYEYREYKSVFYVRENGKGIPDFMNFEFDEESIEIMNDLCRICVLIRNIRGKCSPPKGNEYYSHCSRKVPFKSCKIGSTKTQDYIDGLRANIGIIKTEVNCMDFEFESVVEDLTYDLVLNMKAIGKEFRRNAKVVKEYVAQLTQDEIKVINTDLKFDVEIDGEMVTLDDSYFTIEIKASVSDNVYKVIDNDLTVEVDPTYDLQVNHAHYQRSLVSHIENMRKTLGLKTFHKVTTLIDIGIDNAVYNIDYVTASSGSILDDLSKNLMNNDLKYCSMENDVHVEDVGIIDTANGKRLTEFFTWNNMGTEYKFGVCVYVNNGEFEK
jgi:isoleucyl-tRNA synthetase